MTAEPIREISLGRWRAQLLPRQPYESRYTARDPALGFSYETQAGTHAIASDRMRPFRAMPNGLAFVPAGCSVHSRSHMGGEYLVLTGFEPGKGLDGPFSDRIDHRAIRAARELRRLFLVPGNGDPLHREALFVALVDCLHAQGSASSHGQGAQRWMTPARLEQVFAFVEVNLASPLLVQDIADVLGLSAGFFSRAFRAVTGLAPYAYILDRRLAKVRAALADGVCDLSGLAADTGFSSHAHMATQFRQRYGLAPSTFRDSLRS